MVDRNFFSFNGFRTLATRLGVIVVIFAAGGLAQTFAQDRYAIERAQEAVRERIVRERGGSTSSVLFPDHLRTETDAVSNNQMRVRGEGTFRRDAYTQAQRFTYEAVVNTRNGRVQRIAYNFTGLDNNDDYNNEGNAEVPRWLVGTFRGRNPSNRQNQSVTLTIDRNGAVSALYDNGSRESGNYANGQIRFGGRPAWDVTRASNGFRATSRRRSEDFIRTSGDADDTGRVPRWAVGTFRGTTDTGESELTIGADGTATIRSLRTNETFYGNFSDRILRFEWGDFEVTRERDGIRTTEVNNRRNQTYYRRERGY